MARLDNLEYALAAARESRDAWFDVSGRLLAEIDRLREALDAPPEPHPDTVRWELLEWLVRDHDDVTIEAAPGGFVVMWEGESYGPASQLRDIFDAIEKALEEQG